MAFPNDDPGHWSRTMLWAGLAALLYPALWLAYLARNGAEFEEGYVSFLTDGLVTFLMLVVGTTFAIHLGARQSERLHAFNAIGYACVLAWFAVVIAMSWTLWESRTSTEFLSMIIASPFFVLIGAPGFLTVAVAVWTERRLLYGRPRPTEPAFAQREPQ